MAFTFFFRDIQTLEMIRDHALPYLRTRRYINIWDAGCAMGPEPYTLAMILRETMGAMYFRNIRITASDLDANFESVIKEAVYPREQVERIPKDIFEKYFIKADQPGYFKIVEEIRNALTFRHHDLLTLQPVGTDFGLILCKNVLLHLTEQERVKVIKMFHDSLIEGGFFASEHTQKMPRELEHLFEPVVPNAQLFRKRGA